MLAAIDPGKTGAIALLSADGVLVDVVDMPTMSVRGKDRVNAIAVADLFVERQVKACVIEGVHPFKDGSQTAMFYFGYGAGVLEGVAAGAGVPCQIIPAATWKKRAGVPADKGAARQMASRLWPGAAAKFKLVKNDGRADAALLGRWYATTQGTNN
jgi:crossover junction endodeoxyribonuclease RuvC